jgi:DNA-binding NarL/FixJ family response regulator
VICDYSMPHFYETDVLKLLRSRSSEIPFTFFPETIGEETAEAALKLGAQDYVIKSSLKRSFRQFKENFTTRSSGTNENTWNVKFSDCRNLKPSDSSQ